MPKKNLQLRRKPVQTRSRDREEAILTATRRLLATDGLDALTTTRIAHAAGVPVGSVYYLFPNKYAILAKLLGWYMDHMIVILGENERADPWEARLQETVDRLAKYWRAERAFVQIWSAMKHVRELASADRAADRQAEAWYAAFLIRVVPGVRASAVGPAARTMVFILDRMLEAIANASSPSEARALTRELKRCLVAYVRAFAASAD